MGRRWGKTFMAGSIGLACAARGAAVGWIVPTYKNAKPVWRFAANMVAPLSKHISTNKSDRVIEFPGDGWLGVYTADNPVSILGEAFDLLIIEEAARISPDVWPETLMPTLADRDGRAMLISTPRGKNWFWQEFQKGLADGVDWASFTAPSSANPNPAIRRAAARAKDRVADRTYRQEWLAEFIDDGGGVFRNVRQCLTAEEQDKAIDGHEYCIGVDWGRTEDRTVFFVLDMTTRKQAALDRMNDTAYSLQRMRLRALCDRFGNPGVIAELNSMGGPMVEQLQADGFNVTGFNTTNASKGQIVDALALAFEKGDIGILPDEVQIGELQAYESERLPSGLVRYSAPEGMHDDHVIAAALAWSGLGGGINLWTC